MGGINEIGDQFKSPQRTQVQGLLDMTRQRRLRQPFEVVPKVGSPEFYRFFVGD